MSTTPDPSAIRPSRGGPILTEEKRRARETITALGYAAGYEPVGDKKGVVTHERAASSPGYNLLLSGHAPAAFLLDMDGRTVHRWEATLAEALPDGRQSATPPLRTIYWKRAYLFPNGDLIAMFEGSGLVKLDRDSRVLWRYRGPVHHDLDIDERGHIVTLERRARRLPRIDRDRPTIEDFLVTLDARGRKLEETSILEAVERSHYINLLKIRAAISGSQSRAQDILHTNTVTLLDGTSGSADGPFRKGNILLCIRSLDLVAVLDPSKRALVWGLTGLWVRPHEPVLLDERRLLIFDNEGWARGSEKLSRAFELDLNTQEMLWSYTGPPNFHSPICGLVQRLPNGNTLITVATEGRAIEVTQNGRVVWEFFNPHSTVVDGQDRIATLFEFVRLPRSRVAELLATTG